MLQIRVVTNEVARCRISPIAAAFAPLEFIMSKWRPARPPTNGMSFISRQSRANWFVAPYAVRVAHAVVNAAETAMVPAATTPRVRRNANW